ncbi:hypothetical protein HELRODRAFT_177756 [Helobdella robusta]|uniref:Uncharacterized protein n=1 Tax=Helobdella robusta TaxID=6412 RepID=T1FC73_HELRO|nr:hypothetical protein HELRODRAFT_177756 [Helobdella robusta]ESN97700.1 hypothetical protein HELRODRAFT_177756 [Helobdella robusta]
MVIGMCFDTTASNTGKLNGACTLLEKAMGRNLVWMACRHHKFEVLLACIYSVCLGTSTGPEILFFKRFREKWTEMNHTPEARSTSLIIVSDAIKAFIKCQLEVRHSRDDYLEFLLLAAQIAELLVDVAIRKPGARHRARWMAKAIYALKIELLFTVNKTIFNLNSSRITSFLDVLVENWSDTPSFQVAAVFVKNLVCINDSAERGVALVQHFNETITKDVEQKQFLLQVVEQHRKNFAEYTRELLAKI